MNYTKTSYNGYDRRYKAAIALNNAAISLLDRNCYEDALEMLRIAINLIQYSFCTLGDFGPNIFTTQISFSDDDIQHHLENAAKYQCENGCNFKSNENVRTTTATTATTARRTTIMNKFTTQQNASSVGEIISKANQSGTQCRLSYILIEPIDFDEMNLDSMYHDSMLILYNFGIAHCNLAQQIETKNEKQECIGQRPQQQHRQQQHEFIFIRELRESAFHMFHVIENYVRRKLTYPIQYSQENAVFILSVLFTRAMSELAMKLHYVTMSEYYNVAHIAILILIDAQGRLMPTLVSQAAAA
jgi:hypothetical protein